jgi:hypothetical protein
MRTMKSFRLSHLALLAGTFAVGLSAPSCSSSGAEPSNAYVMSTLGDPPTGTGSCNQNVADDTTLLNLGTPTEPVSSGGMTTVICQVQATGTNSYDVVAQVVSLPAGGFNFSGTLTNTMGPQGPFSASFTAGPDSYNSTACMVTLNVNGFDSSGTPSTTNPSITAGRVWATLSCPMLLLPEDNDTCDGSATFILQNCSD